MGTTHARSGRRRPATTLTLTCESWTGADARTVRALLHDECARWSIDLGWDLGRDWAAIEPARQAGLLPGWILREHDGPVAAWAFGVDLPGVRQIGALCAADPPATAHLLDAVTLTDRDTLAYVRADRAVTPAAFRDAGFAVQRYGYLVADNASRPGVPAPGVALRAWTWDDVPATAALLGTAYREDRGLRPFARGGHNVEWREYVDALTLRPGCGVFSPEASVVLEYQDRLAGVALVTSVGRTTAHIAQMAVAPETRGRGLSRLMLAAARGRALERLGASRTSLMVSDANDVARSIYAREGFRPVGAFIAALKPARLPVSPSCPSAPRR